MSYDLRGALIEHRIIDPANVSNQRVTTYIRCQAVNLSPPDPIGSFNENLQKGCPIVGLLRRIDGPRTDVNDRATFEYYLQDHSKCPGPQCAYRMGDRKRTVNAVGHVSEILAYDAAGRPTRMRDINQIEQQFEYHPRGWLLARRVCQPGVVAFPCPNAAETTMSYTDWGDISRMTLPDGTFIDYGYDDAHRLLSITDALGNRMEFELDRAGRKLRERSFDPNNNLRRILARQYDLVGRLKASFNAPYANASNLDDPTLKRTEYLYDEHGDQHAIIDPLGVRTEQEYDALRRLHRTLQDYGTAPDDINAEVIFDYDVSGNLVEVTDPKGLQTEYIYNGLNDQVELRSPDTGSSTFTYDSAGNRKTQTDARGVITQYSYDALNRLTGIQYPSEPAKNVTFHYDTAYAIDCAPASYRLGRLNRITDHSGTTTFCFDHRGNLFRKIQRQGSVTLTTSWTWDIADRMLTMTYPSGMTVSYGHDGAGRIESLALAGATLAGNGSAQLITDVQYAPFGPITRLDYGDGHLQLRSFDQNYWITSISSTRNIGLIAYFEHDAAANITRLSREVLGTGSGNGSDRNIGYDDLYRITDVLDRNNVLRESFSYDATGNRLDKTGATGIPNHGNYSFANDSHRLTRIDPTSSRIGAAKAPDDGEIRQHDAAGNLVSKSYGGGPLGCCGADYTYDHRGRMESVWVSNAGPAQQTSYRYNGRGERVWRSSADGKPTLYAYDEAGRLLGEYNNTGGLISEVIWLDNLPVGVRQAGTVYPIEADHLGTPRTIHNQNTLLWRWDLFGPVFGEHDAEQNLAGVQFSFNLRFPGQQFDPATRLHYNYFRDYEPGTGRYVQSDPIGLVGGVSTFAYANAAVLTRFDPHGLEDCKTTVSGRVTSISASGNWFWNLRTEPAWRNLPDGGRAVVIGSFIASSSGTFDGELQCDRSKQCCDGSGSFTRVTVSFSSPAFKASFEYQEFRALAPRSIAKVVLAAKIANLAPRLAQMAQNSEEYLEWYRRLNPTSMCGGGR